MAHVILKQGWQSVTFLVRIRDFRIPDFLVKIDTDSRIPDSDYGFFKKTVKDAKISKKSSPARKQSCFIAYELNTLHKDIRIVNVEVPTKL